MTLLWTRKTQQNRYLRHLVSLIPRSHDHETWLSTFAPNHYFALLIIACISAPRKNTTGKVKGGKRGKKPKVKEPIKEATIDDVPLESYRIIDDENGTSHYLHRFGTI